MNDYYRGNAIYQHIQEKGISTFEFVTGNCWQLVYGNENGDPLLLVLAYSTNGTSIEIPEDVNIKKGFKRLQQLSEFSGLPLISVSFDTTSEIIDSVTVSYDLQNFERLTLNKLSQRFASYGLPVKSTSTHKYLNDKTSSAYHKWQRSHLGYNIVVSDIDLWLIEDDKPIVIVELKRSIIALDKWKPYSDDYANFILLAKLCQSSGIKFSIMYNVRNKNPVKEIIDRVKLFKITFKETLNIGPGRIYDIDTVIN